MPEHADDAAVIAASAHNRELFSVIFDRHAPHIHRYLARRLGPDIADDLLAEVFLAAFRRRDRYDQTRPDARPWLYGIAANAIAGHRRAQAHRWRLLAALPPPTDQQPDVADEAEARAGAQASRHALAGGLAELNQAEREVLLLVAWEELSYEQVAEALGVPIGTVRSRLHRGRTKIRARLGGIDPRRAVDPSLTDPSSAERTLKELLRYE